MEKALTVKEIAEMLNVSEQEVVKNFVEDGYMNEDGTPTEKGYNEGIFVDNRNEEKQILNVCNMFFAKGIIESVLAIELHNTYSKELEIDYTLNVKDGNAYVYFDYVSDFNIRSNEIDGITESRERVNTYSKFYEFFPLNNVPEAVKRITQALEEMQNEYFEHTKDKH